MILCARRWRGHPTDTESGRYERLLDHIAGLGSVLVAYSGGVDSTLLAFATHAVLGADTVAALAVSDTYPPSEVESARNTALQLNFQLIEVETYEMSDPRFRANTPERCYFCKAELLDLMKAVANSHGMQHVADGTNADDALDFRPGTRAAREAGVRSPLADAGLTKDEIRGLARELGLPNWAKPSTPCLASRFPYGVEITEDGLSRVASAEEGLRALGLTHFRVRAHGDLARLETSPEEAEAAWTMRERVGEVLREAGFSFVSQDLDGYRQGSLNRVLPAETTEVS